MKPGFTIIELSLVILIIGLLATIGVPRFLKIGVVEYEEFMVRLNSLIASGAQEAQKTNKVQKIFFDIKAKRVELQDFIAKKTKRSIKISDSIELEDFFIDNKSQFALGGGEKFSAYFLINPQGITQNVKLVIIDNKIRAQNPKGGYFEFVLNPLTKNFNLI